jgi:hypothetical protein
MSIPFSLEVSLWSINPTDVGKEVWNICSLSSYSEKQNTRQRGLVK